MAGEIKRLNRVDGVNINQPEISWYGVSGGPTQFAATPILSIGTLTDPWVIWSVIDNICHFSAYFEQVEATAAAPQLEFIAPVASNFINTYDCMAGGEHQDLTTYAEAVRVSANTVNFKINVRWFRVSGTTAPMTVVGSYIIRP